MSAELTKSVFDEEKSEADITLSEYEKSDPISLEDPAINFLKRKVNGSTERQGNRIEMSFTRHGQVTLTATAHVGIVSLPNGPTIEIRPKATGTQLLNLLRYAHGIESTTFEQEAQLQRGNVFIEAIAALFQHELSQVLTHGLFTDYRRRDGTETHLRGRLDLQRQLQRQPPQPTSFECTYDELTPDVTINQAILFATNILLRLTKNTEISLSLERYRQMLRQRVTLRPVSTFELKEIEVTRLNDYYEDILRFTEMIIRNIHISEFAAGDRSSFSLLVNMNTVFEHVVGRAVREAALSHTGWHVREQDTSRNLVDGPNHTVTLRPDFTIRNANNRVLAVGDAKWKTESPQNADFYQMNAYQTAYDAPGLLVYPEQGEKMAAECYLPNDRRLDLIEIPSASNTNSMSSFQSDLRMTIKKAVDRLAG